MDRVDLTTQTNGNEDQSMTHSKSIIYIAGVLNKIFATKCPRCDFGWIHHSHSERLCWTNIEVYECDKCHTKFV